MKTTKLLSLALALLLLASALLSCGQKDNPIGGNGGNGGQFGDDYDINGNITVDVTNLSPSSLLAVMSMRDYCMDVSVTETTTEGIQKSTYNVQKYGSASRYLSGDDKLTYVDYSANRYFKLDQYGNWCYTTNTIINHNYVLSKTLRLDLDLAFTDENYTYESAEKCYVIKQSAMKDFMENSDNSVAFLTVTEKKNSYVISYTYNNNGDILEMTATVSFISDYFELPFGYQEEDNQGGEGGNGGYEEKPDDSDDYYNIFESSEDIYVPEEGIYLRPLKDGGYCVVGADYRDDHRNITIPESYNGRRITRIGRHAFNYNGIYTVSLPETVTVIDDYAFRNCYNLKELQLPRRLESIGKCAFVNCESLTSVTVPRSVTSIGSSAFGGCRLDSFNVQGKSAVVRDDVWYTLDMNAIIYAPYTLTEITVPATVTDIPHAFTNNTNLERVVFETAESGTALKNIGEYAFSYCTALKEIVLPDGIENIDSSAFTGCSSLRAILIPESVKNIMDNAFSSCSALEKVVLSEGLESIYGFAFAHTPIENIYIPSSVNYIGEGAFYCCKNLDNIEINVNNERYACYENCIVDAESSTLLFTSRGRLPKTFEVHEIAAYAFSNGKSFYTAYIYGSVKTVRANAFADISYVNVIIYKGVETIEDYAFTSDQINVYCEEPYKPDSWSYSWHSYPEKVTWGHDISSGRLPEGELAYERTRDGDGNEYYRVIGIGSCTNARITVPKSYNGIPVKEIGDYAFHYLPIKGVELPEGIEYISSMAFAGTDITSVNIPSTVIYINSSAFRDCMGLDRIQISPENKTYFSQGNCIIETDRKQVVFGNRFSTIPEDKRVTSIGYCAFQGCDGLERVIIPDNITYLDNYAFSDCDDLFYVYVGKNVKQISGSTFERSLGIKIFEIDVQNPYYISEGGMLIEKETATLLRGTAVEEIPSYVKKLGYYCFSFLGDLGNVIIPEGIEEIDTDAFLNCKIDFILLPSTLKSISIYAFDSCEVGAISVAANNQSYYAVNNCLIEKESGKILFGATGSSIPQDNSIVAIGENAFLYSGISGTLIIPDNIKTIDYGAFSGCELEEVYIHSGVTFIGNGAFNSYNGNLKIYCEAEELPKEWDPNWFYDGKVFWGSQMP